MNARSEILQKIVELEKEKNNNYKEPDWEEEELKPIVTQLLEAFTQELNALGSECFVVETGTELPKEIDHFLINNGLKNVFFSSPKIKAFCPDQVSLFRTNPMPQLDALITDCECLIGQTGSVIMSSQLKGGRKSWAYPPIHIVVASKTQIVPGIKDALAFLHNKYGEALPSQITMVTGASRTADIEKTLVKGAHGPIRLAVFILKEEIN